MTAEFGATPWGRAWLKTIERTVSSVPNGTLPKARSLVRNQGVRDLTVKQRQLSATVTLPSDHQVTIEVPEWSSDISARVDNAMRQSSPEAAGFAEDDLPDDLIETIRGFGADLTVPNDQWTCQCRCRSRQYPCVHVTASMYAFVQAVDERPLLSIVLRSTVVLDQGVASSDVIALDAINPVTFYGTTRPPLNQKSVRTRADH